MKKISFLLILLTAGASLSYALDKGWVIEATSGDYDYVGAPVANGGIGILPWREPFSIRHVVLNHVMDVVKYDVPGTLLGINPFVLGMSVDGQRVSLDNISGWKQTVDMRRATHITAFTVAGSKTEISYQIRALRNMPQCGLITVTVKAMDDISLETGAVMNVPAECYSQWKCVTRSFEAGKKPVDMLCTNAVSLKGAHRVAASSLFIHSHQFKDIKVDYHFLRAR